jgi:hypothetical protein
MHVGRTAEAIRLLEENRELTVAKSGRDHPDVQFMRENLAEGYGSLGRWAEAEALWRESLARRREVAPRDNRAISYDLVGLGTSLIEQGKWSEAESVLREGLAIREVEMPDSWNRYNAVSRLGVALVGQAKYAGAESLLVQGYVGMKAREAQIPLQARHWLTETGERIVQLYEAWGQPEKAAAWKARLGLIDLPTDVFAQP